MSRLGGIGSVVLSCIFGSYMPYCPQRVKHDPIFLENCMKASGMTLFPANFQWNNEKRKKFSNLFYFPISRHLFIPLRTIRFPHFQVFFKKKGKLQSPIFLPEMGPWTAFQAQTLQNLLEILSLPKEFPGNEPFRRYWQCSAKLYFWVIYALLSSKG